MKIKFKFFVAVKSALSVMVMLILVGCSSPTSSKSKYNAPSDHTISKSGAMHKSGLFQPTANCVSCHGADLKGGTSGVSCYECHGKKW